MATTKHEKVSVNIPHDLSFNILSKLPIKSLRRFSCVTPYWSDLFENPYFMMMYRRNFLCNNNHNISIFLRHSFNNIRDDKAFMLCGEKFENKVKLDWSPGILDARDPFAKVPYIINEIVCLYNIRMFGPPIQQTVLLYNLSNNDFIIIPSGYVHCPPRFRIEVNFHGYGYDNFTNDYKLLRNVTFVKIVFQNANRAKEAEEIEEPPMPLWQLFSLKSDSWKTLNIEMPCNEGEDEVYLNGICHWWGTKLNEDKDWLLVSYNLIDEVFHITPLKLSDCYEPQYRALVVMNNSIAMFTKHNGTTCLDISILGELGVSESWTKIFTIGPLPFVHFPFGFWNRGKILFKVGDRKLYLFDLSTQVFEEIGVNDQEGFYWQISIYKEYLTPIG